MGPPSWSFAADAYDCIMVRIRIGSTEYKCVARCSAPDGELPSDHHADTDKAASDAGASKKGPSRCSSSLRSGVKALRNTSFAKAARRQAPLAFRSLDPFRALREPERRRRDEERPSRSEQRTDSKPKTTA